MWTIIGDPWFYAAAVPATLLAGISKGGFGGGLVSIPLLSLIYGPIEAYAMASIIAVIGYVQLAPRAVRAPGLNALQAFAEVAQAIGRLPTPAHTELAVWPAVKSTS